MKKILIIILISNFAFGQLLNRSEKEVIPVKKFANTRDEYSYISKFLS